MSSIRLPNTRQPVNWQHKLNKNLELWWNPLPQWGKQSIARDLTGRQLVGSGTTSGASPLPTAWGNSTGPYRAGSFNGGSTVNFGQGLNSLTTDFTISLWHRPEGTLANFRNLISKGSTGMQFGIITSAAGLISVQVSPTSDLSMGSIALNTVYHICYKITGGTCSSFIRSEAGVLQTASAARTTATVAANFHIGGDITNSRYALGKLWNVQVFSRALSDDEIADLYYEGKAGLPNTLNYVTPLTMMMNAQNSGGARRRRILTGGR